MWMRTRMWTVCDRGCNGGTRYGIVPHGMNCHKRCYGISHTLCNLRNGCSQYCPVYPGGHTQMLLLLAMHEPPFWQGQAGEERTGYNAEGYSKLQNQLNATWSGKAWIWEVTLSPTQSFDLRPPTIYWNYAQQLLCRGLVNIDSLASGDYNSSWHNAHSAVP